MIFIEHLQGLQNLLLENVTASNKFQPPFLISTPVCSMAWPHPIRVKWSEARLGFVSAVRKMNIFRNTTDCEPVSEWVRCRALGCWFPFSCKPSLYNGCCWFPKWKGPAWFFVSFNDEACSWGASSWRSDLFYQEQNRYLNMPWSKILLKKCYQFIEYPRTIPVLK